MIFCAGHVSARPAHPGEELDSFDGSLGQVLPFDPLGAHLQENDDGLEVADHDLRLDAGYLPVHVARSIDKSAHHLLDSGPGMRLPRVPRVTLADPLDEREELAVLSV